MKHGMYSVYDTKSKTWQNPFYAINDAIAERMIGDAVDDPQTLLSKHPSDFQMYKVGEFDDQEGVIFAHPPEHQYNLQKFVGPE